ncbi:hypothetical protein H0I23_00800 [Cellulophaga sp. HaHaR_3_176]|uniref:type VI secretion system tube protein TssD n=1 Tax=Cellulophaga sp. HaHaR_3_176 TaxID=1942464 RepID=UPI001C1F9AE7|nr:type VI secretion system tube protein TssD [Cellulophaga sp. HaHaR_3_176]QWX84221.1 hypothetical protein H0I23_00800 [Cellulophaga sp. HaHaR_3_176]
MKGILEINGDKLNVLYFNNGIHTEVDSTGRPWGMPKGGVFSITIPLTSNIGGLTRAALDDTLQVKGELLFYQWDMLKIASKLEFANAHVI